MSDVKWRRVNRAISQGHIFVHEKSRLKYNEIRTTKPRSPLHNIESAFLYYVYHVIYFHIKIHLNSQAPDWKSNPHVPDLRRAAISAGAENCRSGARGLSPTLSAGTSEFNLV